MDPNQAYYSQRLKEKNGLIYTKEYRENQQPLNSKEQKTAAWNIQSYHTYNQYRDLQIHKTKTQLERNKDNSTAMFGY